MVPFVFLYQITNSHHEVGEIHKGNLSYHFTSIRRKSEGTLLCHKVTANKLLGKPPLLPLTSDRDIESLEPSTDFIVNIITFLILIRIHLRSILNLFQGIWRSALMARA